MLMPAGTERFGPMQLASIERLAFAFPRGTPFPLKNARHELGSLRTFRGRRRCGHPAGAVAPFFPCCILG